jgi:hypothetical protein
LRRIRVVVVSVLLMVVLAATMAALPAFAGGGRTDADNPKNGFGSAASQQAHNKGDDGKGGLGQHARDPEGDGPGSREGVGNVARNDGAPGDHPGDHGCFVGSQMGIDCNQKPGNRD